MDLEPQRDIRSSMKGIIGIGAMTVCYADGLIGRYSNQSSEEVIVFGNAEELSECLLMKVCKGFYSV